VVVLVVVVLVLELVVVEVELVAEELVVVVPLVVCVSPAPGSMKMSPPHPAAANAPSSPQVASKRFPSSVSVS